MNNLKLKNVLCIVIACAGMWMIGCKPSADTSDNRKDEFKPKGNASDLVYNPVRQDGTIDSSYLPIMTFSEEAYDFGTIFEGDIVEKKFTFTNTGTAPLLILNATSTCGCTIPKWPEKPIPVDSTGTIVVKFDSKNKEGSQNKQVTIFANTFPNKSVITIKGRVDKPNK